MTAVDAPDASARTASKFDIIERGRLMRSLLNFFGSDPEFAQDLEHLGELSDQVPGVSPECWDGPSPEAQAYRDARDRLGSTYGLARIPRVPWDRDPFGYPCFQPSGLDFVQGWCARRRGPRPLAASALGDAAGYFGEVPSVPISIKDEWQLAGREAETQSEFVARVHRALTQQINDGLRNYRRRGRAFGGPPRARRDVHLRWLFERLRYAGKRGQYPQIAKAALQRGEPRSQDLEHAKSEVTRAVTTLGDALGLRVRRREEQ